MASLRGRVLSWLLRLPRRLVSRPAQTRSIGRWPPRARAVGPMSRRSAAWHRVAHAAARHDAASHVRRGLRNRGRASRCVAHVLRARRARARVRRHVRRTARDPRYRRPACHCLRANRAGAPLEQLLREGGSPRRGGRPGLYAARVRSSPRLRRSASRRGALDADLAHRGAGRACDRASGADWSGVIRSPQTQASHDAGRPERARAPKPNGSRERLPAM